MDPDRNKYLREQALERLSYWIINHENLPVKYITDENVNLDSSHYCVSHDPATGRPLVCFEETKQDEMNSLINQASNAQTEWMSMGPLERAKILNNVASLVRSEASWLAELETLDTGKPLWEARADVDACADSLNMFAGFIPTLVGSHVPVPPNPGSFYYTRREPFGVCAGIGAWNFPFQMAVWKSAPALAAGNAFVFKPSPLTPLTAVRLSQLYRQAGCPSNLFCVVLGGSQVGQALISHPSVAKVSFTGGLVGARAVLHAAAEKIIPCTVESGGKSALIIMPDADLNEAVKGTIMANFYTQGQVCSNAARVFVHRTISKSFQQKLIKAVTNITLGDPFDPSTSMGALISPEHRAKVCDYIQSAVSEGAKILCGGETNLSTILPSYLCGGNFMKPCILDNCTDSMKAVKEEIFGPVITLLEFDDEEEVIQRANNSDLGLAGGVFTNNLATAHRIASNLQCGSVYVNSYNAYPPGIPFGGYKKSGFGRENSIDCLHSYSQIKAVYVEGGKLPEPFH